MIRDDLQLGSTVLDFVVAAAAAGLSVNVGAPTPGFGNLPSDFISPGGNRLFGPREPCILRRVVPLYPHQFGGSLVIHFLTIQRFVTGVGLQGIPEFGNASIVNMHSMCEPVEMDLFIAPPVQVATWKFQLVAITASVSMANVPTLLDTTTQRPNYSLIVDHTLPLTV